MEHWPRPYHCFHTILNAGPLPELVYYLRFCLLFARFVALIIFPMLVWNEEVTQGSLKTINSICMAILRLSPIDRYTALSVLCTISISCLLVLLFLFYNSGLLLDKLNGQTALFIFSFVAPVGLGWSSSNLQSFVSEFLETGVPNIQVMYAVIATICFSGMWTVYLFFSARPLTVETVRVMAWDTRFFGNVMIMEEILQHLWSLLALKIWWVSYFLVIVNLIFSLTLLVMALDFPFVNMGMNIAVITVTTVGSFQSLLFGVLIATKAKPITYLVSFGIMYLCVRLYLSEILCNLRSKSILKHLSTSKQIVDLSDDMEPQYVIPDLKPKQMIKLIRLMVTLRMPEVSGFISQVVEQTNSTEVILECYRMLWMIESIPSLAWKRILEMERCEVARSDQGLFCELQYEAIKIEENPELTAELISMLDKEKEKMQMSLRGVCESLCDDDGQRASYMMSRYASVCHSYKQKVEWFIKCSPKSHLLASHYADFLRKFQGRTTEAQFWQKRADALKRKRLTLFSNQSLATILSNPSSSSNFGSFSASEHLSPEEQHRMSEEVVSRIVSKALPLAVGLFGLFFAISMSLTHNTTGYQFLLEHAGSYPIVRAISASFVMMRQVDRCLAAASQLDWINVSLTPSMKDLEVSAMFLSNTMKDVFRGSLCEKDISAKWTNDGEAGSAFSVFHLSIWLDEYGVWSNVTSENLERYWKITNVAQLGMKEFDDFVTSNQENFERTFVLQVVRVQSYLLVIMAFLFVGVLVMCSWYFPEEIHRFVKILLGVDKESILRFRNFMMPKQPEVPEGELEYDEFALTEDEIEVSDEDPISAPIILPDMTEIDRVSPQELGKGAPTNPVSGLKPFLTVMVVFLVVHVFLVFLFQLWRYKFVHHTVVSGQISADKLAILSDMSTLMVHGVGFKHGFENISYLKTLTVRSFPKTRDNAPLLALREKFLGSWAQFLAGNAPIEECIELCYDEMIDRTREIIGSCHQTAFSSYSMVVAMIRLLSDALLVSVSLYFVAYVKECSYFFDSFKRILRLMPCRFFSPIAVALAQFRNTINTTSESEIEPYDILRCVHEPLFILDHKRRIRDTNQSFLSLFLYKKEHILQRDMSILFANHAENELIEFVDECIHGNRFLEKGKTFETRAIRSDGNTIPVTCKVLPFLRHNKVIIVLLVTDKTLSLKQHEALNEIDMRVQALLNSVLPCETIPLYLSNTARIMFNIESGTMLVIRVLNFEEWCMKSNTFQIIDISDLFFNVFDKLLPTENIAKIRQMNLTYSVVAGVFDHDSNATLQAFRFAQRCLKVINKRNQRCHESWAISMCLYSLGPFSAGILSRNRPIFDIYTDERMIVDVVGMNCPEGEMIMNDQAVCELGLDLQYTEYPIIPELATYTLKLSSIPCL